MHFLVSVEGKELVSIWKGGVIGPKAEIFFCI